MPDPDLVFEVGSRLPGSQALGPGVSRSRNLRARESLVSLELGGNGSTGHHAAVAKVLVSCILYHELKPGKPWSVSHTIFEGTSEIQQLVIARAISGLRIE